MGHSQKDKSAESPERSSSDRIKINSGSEFTVADDAERLLNREVSAKEITESLGETTDCEEYMLSSINKSSNVNTGACAAADDAQCLADIESTDQMVQEIECATVQEKVVEGSTGDERGLPPDIDLGMISTGVANTVRTGNVKILREGDKSMLHQEEKRPLLSVTKCTEISDRGPIAVDIKHSLSKGVMMENMETSYAHACKQGHVGKIRLLPSEESSTETNVCTTMKANEGSTLGEEETFRTGITNPEPARNETTTIGKVISPTELQLISSSVNVASPTSSTNIQKCTSIGGVANGGTKEEVKKEIIMVVDENGRTRAAKYEDQYHEKGWEALSGTVRCDIGSTSAVVSILT